MDKQCFERNLLALSSTDPRLCSGLSSAVTTRGIYRFLESRTGEVIPALLDSTGQAHPLHSTVDPHREGERLISTLHEEGYVIFLGLGGAFAAEAALERTETKKVLVIEYDRDGIAELLSSRDYISLLKDPRFRILPDPSEADIEKYLLETYIPAVDGGIRVFPLRIRTDKEERFSAAGDAIKRSIDAVSRDYSVQAYFGKRWFANIIRNLPLAEGRLPVLPPLRRAAICAAGPSLDEQIPRIKKNRDSYFLIAADTSLSVLLHGGIEPDGVVSIDCQHISYRHFFQALPAKTMLFLDLASPPPVGARTENRFFFCGGHPLTRYISRKWRALPVLDTSGANVSYAAFSLAEILGAGEIILYGADFSYPQGQTYARGTYIYPYFECFQSRHTPLEAQHSAFLYRDPSLKKESPPDRPWYYETQSLRFYRERLYQKAASSGLRVEAPGPWGTLLLCRGSSTRNLSILSTGPVRQGAMDFLRSYKKSLEALRSFDPLEEAEPTEEAELLTTLLPLAAFIRKKSGAINKKAFFESLKSCCLEELSRVIHN
ncbi:MAG: DUF115 domain-containing protein [Spirochaetaceae bacterium]|jgi:hypothetical protein|nr:DUF115 domain-containing protein [Spirochaetaceae bacterium]